MADIKLCDKCGNVFNPRGVWQSLSAVTFTLQDGDSYQVRHDTTLELCGSCAIIPNTSSSVGNVPVALTTGRQLVDEERDIWSDPVGAFHIKRGDQWIGPFTSKGSAGRWLTGEAPVPEDEGYET